MLFMERVGEAQRIAAIQMRETDSRKNGSKKRKGNNFIRDDAAFDRADEDVGGSSFNLNNNGGGIGAMSTGRKRKYN